MLAEAWSGSTVRRASRVGAHRARRAPTPRHHRETPPLSASAIVDDAGLACRDRGIDHRASVEALPGQWSRGPAPPDGRRSSSASRTAPARARGPVRGSSPSPAGSAPGRRCRRALRWVRRPGVRLPKRPLTRPTIIPSGPSRQAWSWPDAAHEAAGPTAASRWPVRVAP